MSKKEENSFCCHIGDDEWMFKNSIMIYHKLESFYIAMWLNCYLIDIIDEILFAYENIIQFLITQCIVKMFYNLLKINYYVSFTRFICYASNTIDWYKFKWFLVQSTINNQHKLNHVFLHFLLSLHSNMLNSGITNE